MEKMVMVWTVAHPENLDHFMVEGSDADGRVYTHERLDLTVDQAIRLVARIEKNDMVIDPVHWYCYTPYGTRAWIEEGHEERLIADERNSF